MRARNKNCMASAAFVVFAMAASPALTPENPAAAPVPPAAITALPPAPERALVLNYCDDCHGIDWVLRSGGSVAGWTDRIQRMIRGGAAVPRDQIPAIAAYLAKALPPRPAPPDPP